jgi:lysophospholipase
MLTKAPLFQHLAATCPNLEILRDFLSQGASVHLRNRDGRTPLFLAAEAGRLDNVVLLAESGAHLHADEKGLAAHLKQRAEEAGDMAKSEAWRIAGA